MTLFSRLQKLNKEPKWTRGENAWPDIVSAGTGGRVVSVRLSLLREAVRGATWAVSRPGRCLSGRKDPPAKRVAAATRLASSNLALSASESKRRWQAWSSDHGSTASRVVRSSECGGGSSRANAANVSPEERS